jgi:DNA-binding NarL/FixJ family response regulator
VRAYNFGEYAEEDCALTWYGDVGMPKTMIMIVSNHPSFRIAVRRAISKDTNLEAKEILECDPGDDGNNAIAEIAVNSPNIVLLDMRYPVFNEFNLARRIAGTFARISVILLSAGTQDTDNELFEAAKSGAIDYLGGKQPGGAGLVEAIKRASMGEHPIIEKVINNRKVAWRILKQFREMSSIAGAMEVAFQFNLDSEEFQILQLIAQGTQKNQVAGILRVNELILNERMNRILFKLNSNESTLDTFTRVRDSLLSLRLARDGNIFILDDSPVSRLPQLLHGGAQQQ